MDIKDNEGPWWDTNANSFWGEIACCDHVLQIYESEASLLQKLATFVGDGLTSGDNCIVIATEEHLAMLAMRLEEYGIENLGSLTIRDRYIPLDAQATLSSFMVDNWPDEKLFRKTISEVVARAGFRKKRIRAFGEMVALLWAQGLIEATIQLENLWNEYCSEKSFCLFCAYPRSGFTSDAAEYISHICKAHTKIIDGSHHPAKIRYRNVG